MDVFEVASFYTMYNRDPVGKYHLQVCNTTPCMVSGSDKLLEFCEEYLGIHIGQTTKDGLFTLSEVECLGACANAPMLQVNGEWVYEDLTQDSLKQLLDDFRDGKEPIKGPQNGRKNCEGIMGRSTLMDLESVYRTTSRDFGKAKDDWAQAKLELEKKAKEAAAQKK